MGAASDLIERAEKEAGCRVDENEFENNAMDVIFGALSRELGQSPPKYRPEEDMAAGVVIRHQMTPEYEAEQRSLRMLAKLISGGADPETAKALIGSE